MDLQALCDDTLIETLREKSPGLVAAIDAARKAGAPKDEILARIRRVAESRGPTVLLACEAYIERMA